DARAAAGGGEHAGDEEVARAAQGQAAAVGDALDLHAAVEDHAAVAADIRNEVGKRPADVVGHGEGGGVRGRPELQRVAVGSGRHVAPATIGGGGAPRQDDRLVNAGASDGAVHVNNGVPRVGQRVLRKVHRGVAAKIQADGPDGIALK